MDKVLSVLKSTKILGIVGSILLIIGTLFPFYTVSFLGIKASVKLIENTTGKIMLIVGIISLAMIFIDFIISKIPEGKATFLLNLRNQKLILIPAAIALILLIVSANQDTYGLGKLAFGFYLLLIGIIALVAYPFMYKGE
jgi:hypothetical protein